MNWLRLEENMAERSAPWRLEKVPGGYAVRDAKGMLIAHVYGQEFPGSIGMTLEQAKEIASQIAKLPELRHLHPIASTGQKLPSARRGVSERR